MSESRESSLAAILARGLIRVRQRVERTGDRPTSSDDAECAPARSDDASPSTNNAVDTSEEGEPE